MSLKRMLKSIQLRWNPYGGVAVVAMMVYCLKNLADPLHYGRDFATYWLYFRDIWLPIPEFPIIMLFRTPVAPLLLGIVFAFGSWMVVQLYFAFSYVIVALCLFATVRRWGDCIAWLTLLLVGLCNEFFWVFNSVASENPTTLLMAIWVWLVFRCRRSVKVWEWVGIAVLTILLVLTRPNHQVLALVAVLPFLNARNPWYDRLKASMVFLLVLVAGILAYCGYNGLRYDSFRLIHLGPAHMPFYRLFIHEKMIRPENGPVSAQLGEIVREDILTREVFLKYGIDETLFWEGATPRFWIHIVDALNHRYGHLDNNQILKEVAMEAHHRFPHVFWLSFWDTLRRNFEFPARPMLRPRSVVYTDMESLLQREYDRFEREGLEIPSEADLIPGVLSQLTFRPENYPEYVGGNPQRWEIPTRDVSLTVKRIYYLLGQLRPSISTVFLLVALALIRTRLRDWDFVRLTLMGGIVVVMLSGTAMANPEPQFRYPFDPFFMLWGLVALRLILFPESRHVIIEQTNNP